MKRVHLIIVFLLLSKLILSQDLIVTPNGDSINCKITKITNDFIFFFYRDNDDIRNTLLPSDKVKLYARGFYRQNVISDGTVVKNRTLVDDFPRFRMALNGGWSYRTAKLSDAIPSDFEQYMRKLKSGYHINGDLSYFISEQLGFGIKYNYSNFKSELNDIIVILPDSTIQTGKMSDNIHIQFIGPFVSFRTLDMNNINSIYFNMAFGYLSFKDDAVLISRYKLTGKSAGLYFDMGYDFSVSKDLVLGIQLSYLISSLSKYDLDDGTNIQTIKLEEGNYESLSRLDLSIGLRFIK
nr:hypothetical protein [Bacteroidota bacterium]